MQNNTLYIYVWACYNFIGDMTKMNELSKRFKQFRIYCELTQEDLSQRSGVSIYTIKKFENGADIRISTLDKLLKVLGMNDAIDNLIPDMRDRPSFRFEEEKGQIRQRVRKSKEKTTWSWGE